MPSTYSVRRGDCLYNIAKAHGITLGELLAANPKFSRNGRHPNLIFPGETVEIPDKPGFCSAVDVANGVAGCRSGEDAFRRDASGNIVATKLGGPYLVQHGGAPGVYFQVDQYALELADGSTIEAYKSAGRYDPATGTLTADNRMDTDCHGVTFTGGEYWINDDQVEQLLAGGGFTMTGNPQPGDVLVYRNAGGDVVHSVTVTTVDSASKVTEVIGLGGLETTPHSDPPDTAWGDPSATRETWTK